MRLGMIVRADNTGLGIQTWEAYRHLKPDKIMLVELPTYHDQRLYPERFDGGIMVANGAPVPEQVDRFLSDIDILFTCETTYSYYMLSKARERGVLVLIQANYEFSPWLKNKNLPKPALFGMPSKWHYDEMVDPKIHLPVPIATERFMYRNSDSAKKFLHVVGKPAGNDRNGTRDLIESLKFIESEIDLTIVCQKPAYVDEILRGKEFGHNIRIHVDGTRYDNYWDLYTGYDALIMPRRYGGLCLPVNEALGAGIPVIMPDISPNEWLPKDWLVPAIKDFEYKPNIYGPMVDVYKVEPLDLATKIEEFVRDKTLYQLSVKHARRLAKQNSWDALLPLYETVFSGMMQSKHKE